MIAAVTAIITAAVTAVVTTVVKYVSWQLTVLDNPLYRYIIYHLLLLSVLMFIFIDSRYNFRKIRTILTFIFMKLIGDPKKETKKSITLHYHQRLQKKKVKIMPIIITLLVSYFFYSQMLFFTVVTSSSMYPTFNRNDLVLMQKIDIEPEAGDIVIFNEWLTPMPITHRVTEVYDDTFKTKGDNNPKEDSFIAKKDHILGIALELNGKPIVIKDIGDLFLIDYTTDPFIKNRPGYGQMARAIQTVKELALPVFILSIMFYALISMKKTKRRIRHRL